MPCRRAAPWQRHIGTLDLFDLMENVMITSDGHITQAQAVSMLRSMMFLIQKARSNAHDPFFGVIDQDPDGMGMPVTEELLAGIFPWLFGDKCPLSALGKILDRTEETGELAPFTFYNMMTVLYTFLPQLVAVSPIVLNAADALPPFPPDHMVYLRGWVLEESEK